MAFNRFPVKDPRTVARDIPGLFDVIFPQLTQGIVVYFNRRSQPICEIESVPETLVSKSTLAKSMLFELAYVRADQKLNGQIDTDWNNCLIQATKKQRRHFDAKLPDQISEIDITIAELVASNLVEMLAGVTGRYQGYDIEASPIIPGYLWVSSGHGDFSIKDNLIEVKCTANNYGSADYRQVLMYWLLSYANSLEKDSLEWKSVTLLNPRLNKCLDVKFDEIIPVISAGKSKIEILELFTALLGRDLLKGLQPF